MLTLAGLGFDLLFTESEELQGPCPGHSPAPRQR